MSQKVDEQQPGRSTFSKWAIGVGTSVLVAFLVALVTGLANNLVDDRDAVTAVQGSRPQSTPDSGETPPSPVDEPVEPLIDSYLRVIGGGVILDDPFAVEWPAGSDDPADYDRAAIDQVGAVPAKFQVLEVTVQNPTDAEIVISEPIVEVISAEPPRAGVHAGSQEGGLLATYGYSAQLFDGQPPSIRPIDVPGAVTIGTRFSVGPGDPVTFDVDVESIDCECRWQVEIPWVSNGIRGSTTLTSEGGEPFQLTSLDASQGFYNVFTGDYFPAG